MSTRGIIVFVGKSRGNITATRLYQHCDTYPTNVLPTLRDVLRNSRKFVEKYERLMHPEKFVSGRTFNFHTSEIPTELLVGKYIGETTDGHGMSAYIERTIHTTSTDLLTDDATTREAIFGVQQDLEWIYLVDAINHRIRVFGGGYTGQAAHLRVTATADPMGYLDCLVEEYQESEGKRIKAACRSLNRLGFPVNPQRLSGRRAAHAAQRAQRNEK